MPRPTMIAPAPSMRRVWVSEPLTGKVPEVVEIEPDDEEVGAD